MGGGGSKSVGEVVDRLLAAEIKPSEATLLDALWTCDASVDLIRTAISPSIARKLLGKQPGNARRVFKQAVAQLSQVIETPYPVYFQQALTCSRVLARLLPVMLEVERKSEFVYLLLWGVQQTKKTRRLSIPAPVLAQSVGTEESSTQSSAQSSRRNSADSAVVLEMQQTVVHKSQPLGNVLLHCIFNLFFLPEFTIAPLRRDYTPEEMETRAFKAAVMWTAGVGSVEKTVSSSSAFDMNRIDVLRLLLSACVSDVYCEYRGFEMTHNKFLRLACASSTPYAEVLLYSLLNTILGYDPVGWSVPFASYVTRDTAKQLLDVSIDALLVLLNFGLSLSQACDAANALAGGAASATQVEEVPGYNVFRFHLSALRRDAEFNFIFKGFVRLLQHISATRAADPLLNDLEAKLVLLLWRLLDDNDEFLDYFISQNNCSDVWIPLLEAMLLRRKDPKELNLIYQCTLILLKLSSNRSFSIYLNSAYEKPKNLPGVGVVEGAYSDLLVIVIHKMMVSGADALFPIFGTMLTVICNFSPYVKSMAAMSAIKLVNVFHLLTSPRFIFNAEANHVLLSLLIDSFNNIIQYQYTGNTSLVYAIICRKADFYDLHFMTLSAAVKGYEEMTHGSSGPASRVHVEMAVEMAVQEKELAVLDSDDEDVEELLKRQPLSVHVAAASEPSLLKKPVPDAALLGTLQGEDEASPTPSTPGAAVRRIRVHSITPDTVVPPMSACSPSTQPSPGEGGGEGGGEGDIVVSSEASELVVGSVQALAQAEGDATGSASVESGIDSKEPALSVVIDEAAQRTSVEELPSETSAPSPEHVAEALKEDSDVANGAGVALVEESELVVLSPDAEPSAVLDTSYSSDAPNELSMAVSVGAAETSTFSPTQDWLDELKASLQLSTIIKLLNYLAPLVEHFAVNNVSMDAIFELIDKTMMVGILPVPHPIVIRKHTSSRQTATWSVSFAWELIQRSNQALPYFDSKCVRLFDENE